MVEVGGSPGLPLWRTHAVFGPVEEGGSRNLREGYQMRSSDSQPDLGETRAGFGCGVGIQKSHPNSGC